MRLTGIPHLDAYYHPDVAIQGFNRTRDAYSLAIVLFDIALWAPVACTIPEDTGKSLEDMSSSEFRAHLLDSMPTLGAQVGIAYPDAVESCLSGDFGVGPDSEDNAAIGRAFFTKVLKGLGSCRV
ncbi:hypothetical protein MMC25_002533 [Agyrium rufum]|nr:hypothetical protein [Agyrium rufum]